MPLVLHPESTCDICLESFCDTLPPHVIPCGHIFCEPCFKNAHYRQHLCGLCREPYRPERVKRLHVEMKYTNSPQSNHGLVEQVQDQAADGSTRRTELPTDHALLFKLATALDLRQEAPVVKRLKTALRQATKWKNANEGSPSGLALKNLLKFVEDYRFAVEQCRLYEIEVQRLGHVTGQTQTDKMHQELKDTQGELRELRREMARLKAMTSATYTPSFAPNGMSVEYELAPSPRGAGLSPQGSLRQGSSLDAQRRFLQGYSQGKEEVQRALSSLGSPTSSMDSRLLEPSEIGLATPSSLGSGSPLPSLRGDLEPWEGNPHDSPSLTPVGLGDVSRNGSRRSRRSGHSSNSATRRSPPRAPRMTSTQRLPSNASASVRNSADSLPDLSSLFQGSGNRNRQSAASEMSWGTSTSGNTLNRLGLGQLPGEYGPSTFEDDERILF